MELLSTVPVIYLAAGQISDWGMWDGKVLAVIQFSESGVGALHFLPDHSKYFGIEE